METKTTNPQPPEKKANFLLEFFWICSGVNREILRKCPTDWSKYFGQGGLIFFTAVMASLSGGYAIFTVFKSTWLGIVFGLIWGLLIFNLDRFIVNTMYSDGKHTISGLELWSGLPRIIIAIFLGIVISTPLELKIFEDEINLTISDMKKEKIRVYTEGDDNHIAELESKKMALNSKIDSVQSAPVSLYSGSISSGNTTLNALLAERKSEQDRYEHARQEISVLTSKRSRLTDADSLEYRRLTNLIWKERQTMNRASASISNLNGRIGSQDSDLRDLLKKNESIKETSISSYRSDIAAIDSEIARLKDNRDNAEEKYKVQLDNEYGGFQARMKAFNRMRNWKTERATFWVSLFIMLLFVIIEVSPTIFKMMVAAGPYDDMLAAERHRIQIEAQKQISDLNDEVNTQIQISTAFNQNKLDAEIAGNKALLEKIAIAQAELMETAIQEWRDQELRKIKEDASRYIKTKIG